MRIISRAPGSAVRYDGLGARALVLVMTRVSCVLHESSPHSARKPVQLEIGALVKYPAAYAERYHPSILSSLSVQQ
jgi:hypothetical protein